MEHDHINPSNAARVAFCSFEFNGAKVTNGYKREGENERKKFERGIELKDNAQFIILLFIVTAHAIVTSFFSLSLYLILFIPTYECKAGRVFVRECDGSA